MEESVITHKRVQLGSFHTASQLRVMVGEGISPSDPHGGRVGVDVGEGLGDW